MPGEEPPETTSSRPRSAPRVSTSGPHQLQPPAPLGGHPLPAASPSTHVPTLPPRGPAAVRHIGVVLALSSAVAVIVVLALVLALPSAPPKTAVATLPTTTTTTTAPAPAADPLVFDDLEALSPVPMTHLAAPLDGRQRWERAIARRGLRSGDVPAADALVARAATLEKAGRDVEAAALVKQAQARADKQVIDRGFVFAKQKRLNIAVEDRGTKDARRFDELSREIERRFAAHDYAGANEALNRAFVLLK